MAIDFEREYGPREAMPDDDDDDDCQPDYTCIRCSKPAVGAVAIILSPWALNSVPPATAGWLCGACADDLRDWLAGEGAAAHPCKTPGCRAPGVKESALGGHYCAECWLAPVRIPLKTEANS